MRVVLVDPSAEEVHRAPRLLQARMLAQLSWTVLVTPIPDPVVSGHRHDGPHDGEIIPMPWARIEVPVGRWEGEEWVESIYRLDGPWRGQDTAEYRYVPEIAEEIASAPRPGVVALACLWLSRRLAELGARA
jgi:hypothetical protein